MELKVPEFLRHQVERTRAIVTEIRIIKEKDDLTDQDIERLLDLRTELAAFSPPERFAWIDGEPVLDILDELIRIKDEI